VDYYVIGLYASNTFTQSGCIHSSGLLSA